MAEDREGLQVGAPMAKGAGLAVAMEGRHYRGSGGVSRGHVRRVQCVVGKGQSG